MNTSLGQNVSFTGNLVLPQSPGVAERNYFSNTLSPVQSQFQQRATAEPLQNLNGRVSGTAVIDGVEGIRVEAVPVGQ